MGWVAHGDGACDRRGEALADTKDAPARGPQSATREQAKAVKAPAPKADWSGHR